MTGVSAGITSYTNPADNRILTSVNSTTINSESNLTFDGTILSILGGTSQYFKIDTSGLYGYIHLKAGTNEGYLIQNVNGGTSNNVGAGSLYLYMSNSQNFEFSWAGTTKVLFTSAGAATFASTVTSSVDVRGPIFYDSNNTGYYLDPASTSNLNALTLAGVLYGTTQNLNSTLTITDPIAGNAPRIYTSITTGPSATASVRFGLDQSTSGGANMFMGGSQKVGGNSTNPNIFFTDSREAYASISGIYTGAGSSATAGHIAFNTTPNITTTALTERMRITKDGNVSATIDFRAPIFYDSANTANYIDPAGTSNLNYLYINSYLYSSQYYSAGYTFMFQYGNSTSGTSSTINLSSSASDPSNIASNLNNGITWGTRTDNQPYYMIYCPLVTYNSTTYNRLTLSWHTGIQIGASSSYGGTRFFNNSINLGTQIFSVGDGDNHVRVSNNLYVTGTGQSSADFRAPIFYDSNDTNFYVNPASLSYFSSIQTASTALIGSSLTVGTNLIGFVGGNISGFGSITVDRLTSKSGTVALSSAVASALFTVDPHSTWIVFIAPSNTGSDDGNFTGIVTRDYGRTPVLTTLTSTAGNSGRQYSLTVSGSVVNGYTNIGGTAYWQAIRIG